MIPYMKKRMNYVILLSMLLVIGMGSCAGLREKKAEKSQPFSPHHNKKPHHGHP
ncbi:MAG: hypothetical protein JWO58_2787 [Chitinophagaceae bacterium]|nr:hypothetical protein [Chitinophagaceae bacterium]